MISLSLCWAVRWNVACFNRKVAARLLYIQQGGGLLLCLTYNPVLRYTLRVLSHNHFTKSAMLSHARLTIQTEDPTSQLSTDVGSGGDPYGGMCGRQG